MKILWTIFPRKEIYGSFPRRVRVPFGLPGVHHSPLHKLGMKAAIKTTDQLVKQGKPEL